MTLNNSNAAGIHVAQTELILILLPAIRIENVVRDAPNP